ncbi:hypothetical protein TRFO_37769 [Tritrichomonas foetus]|uniref:Uncharacterized protein n=1 Tax=Tritrichomonas foetus TaxID=1144522 RepID=A0A1J4JAA1_9EUKA|nr:hypothetical protein TRFO_37769 [Tritrichomonas foetus]|eukprot:OHS96098.1 hypothetical protein TRFO_37769 [Tritrichomonas foetus]
MLNIINHKIIFKNDHSKSIRLLLYFFFYLHLFVLNPSPRLTRSKIIPKDTDSVAQSIYLERKRTFLASLDTILRQIGCLNRRDITKHIDDTVNDNLNSEREVFISKITNIILKDTEHAKESFDAMCSKLVGIADRGMFSESSIRSTVSRIRSKNPKNITDQPILNLLSSQMNQLSQLRGEIGFLKSSVLSIISSFLSSLTQSRQKIKSSVLRALNEANMRNEQLEIQLKAQQKSSQERESKIASLEQKLAELNDQVVFLKQQRASNARVTHLERQLAEKNRQLEEQKQQMDETIAELEQELEDKTNFLEEQRKSSNAQIFQLEQRLDSELTKMSMSGLSINGDEIEELEAQIAERDQIIEQQKRSSQIHIAQLEELLENQRQKSTNLNAQLKSKDQELEQIKLSISNYESQLSQRTDEITLLEAERTMSHSTMTLAELEDMKAETQEKEEEIQQLKSQLESMSNYNQEIDTLRTSYLKKSQEVDELKKSTEIAQKNAIELENKNRSLIQSYKALELQLSHGKNEQTSLQSDIDHALMICQIRKKKIKQLKNENVDLRNQLAKFKKLIDDKDLELTKMRQTKYDENLEASYLKQQLSVSQTDTERHNSMINTMKEKLANSLSILQEKERVIDEMMEMDKQKAAEIDSLNKQLTKLTKDKAVVQSKLDLINKTQQLDEQQKKLQEQDDLIRKLSSALTHSKANQKSVELIAKEQQTRIKELVSNLKENRQTIRENESEIHRLLDLTADLTNQHSTITEQNDAKINQFRDQTDQNNLKLEKLTRKNASLTHNINQLQEKIKSLNSEIESLKMQNLKLEAENTDMNDQINTTMKPLQQENNKLRTKLAKLTTSNQEITEKQEKFESQYTELRLQSQSKISVLEKRVNDLTNQLQQTKYDYDANISEMEKHFQSMNLRLKGTNSSNDEYTALYQELQKLFCATSFENLLLKSTEKVNECASLQNELQTMKSNAEKLSKTMFDKDRKVENLANEKRQLSELNEQLREKLHSSETDKLKLLDQIEKLNITLKIEKEEHETTKLCFDELRDDLSGFKNLIQFDSVSELKKQITRILEDNSKVSESSYQSSTAILQLESQITKLKKENTDNTAFIKEQNATISQLSKSEKDLKNEVLRLSKNSSQSTFELQNQLQKTKDQLKLILSSISKLHEIVTFTSNDDIYIAVSSTIHQKDQKIEDLQHQVRKYEVKSNEDQIKLDSSLNRINEMQNEIAKLRNEQFEHKREKTQTDKDLSNFERKYNALRNEIDHLNSHNSKLHKQISNIIPFNTFDELPTAIYGFKEEFDLQKQKNKMLKENNNQLRKQLSESENNLENATRQLMELQQEKIGINSQMKRKEIIDSQIYGVTTLQELPKKFTEIKQKLEDTEQRLEIMGDKCKNLNKKLLSTDQELFLMKTNYEELMTTNAAIQKQLDQTTKKNIQLEDTVQSMTNQVIQYEERFNILEDKNSEFKEKVSDYDKVINQLNDVLDFEDSDGLVQVVKDLKNENDQIAGALFNTKRQLKEMFESLPDLILTSDINVPMSNSMLNEIKEYLTDMSASANSYSKNEKFIVSQATKNGYQGSEIGGALNHISAMIEESKKNKEECIQLKEKMRLIESNSIDSDNNMKVDYENQIKQIQNLLDESNDRNEKLNQVKNNLIRLKAGELVDEELLKEELTEKELDKIGIVVA